MTSKVVVTDLETGDVQEFTLEPGNYVIFTEDPSFIKAVHVVTGPKESDLPWINVVTIANVQAGRVTDAPVRCGKPFEGVYTGYKGHGDSIVMDTEEEAVSDAVARAERSKSDG